MPGIVGLVQSDGAGVAHRIAAAASKLQHLDSLTMRSDTMGGVGLAQVWRDAPRPDRDWFDGDGVAIRVAGHVLCDRPSPCRLGARDLADAFRAHGRVPVEQYDGAFTVVVVDRARRLLHVSNDRLGAYPIYLTRTDGALAFGPEIKSVLAAAGARARLHLEGVVSFISFGYCIGPTTLFEGVTCLAPASTLTVDLDSLAHRVERYWNLRFAPARSLSPRARAVDAHYETLLASQRLILCDDPPSYEVLLSGGLDSRGVVAFGDALGRPPAATLTWGATDTVPDSDAFVARRIAQSYRIPHRFLAYDTGDFVANARDWTFVSELANDNIGWYAEGQPTLAGTYRSGAAFAATGDVVWDSGGFAFSAMEMRRAVLPPDLPEPLVACLRPAAVSECRHICDAEIARVMADCPHEDLTDRKEYLYLYARVARYILSLGYYREHAVEVRRPFLTKAVLDLFASLPQKHRVEKNAYISMLQSRFPRLMEIPEQSAWSLPRWDDDVRAPGPLRELWLRYLERERLEAGVLGGIVDGDAFVARRDAFFSSPHEPPAPKPFKARFPLRGMVLPLVQRHRALDRISRLVRVGPGFLPRSDFDIMRCVALLAILEDSLDRFAALPPR